DHHNDGGDHERVDDGHVKDQQTPNEGTDKHRRNGNQATACFRSASTHETTICADAYDCQGEDSRCQIGHSELAGGSVLYPHRDAEHDVEAIVITCWHRITGQCGQDCRDDQQERL